MGSTTRLDPSFTIFQPCFWLRKWQECDTCIFDRVSFVWPTLAIATMPFSWFLFCHVEHRQLTTCSAMARKLARPFQAFNCQNTRAPHYTAARDWLKSKGVSALTDRSGVVYWLSVNELRQYVCAIVAYVFLLSFFRSRLPASDHNF